jgi:hypothetical protein
MYSIIYWITRLDYVLGFATGVLIVFGMIAMVGFINADFDGAKKDFFKQLKKNIYIPVVAILILLFVPSKNDAILIYAGGKAYEYVKSDTSLQKLPYQTTEYLKLVFQKEINELKKEAK